MSIDRPDLLRASTTLTGIDFIYVAANQIDLTIFLHHEALPAALKTALEGLGPNAFHITAIGAVAPAVVPVVAVTTPLPAPVDGRAVMQIRTEFPGGFGPYRLAIDSPAIDPFFNDIRFSFKAGCDSDLDCKTRPRDCPPDAIVDYPVDYRARDFNSFRQVLMDFASQRYPDWQDRLEADIGVMVMELFAALGDELSYADDRLNREGSIDLATQRRSLRHLAALVDYTPDNGSGAWAWIDVQASAPGSIPAGTQVSDIHEKLVFEIGNSLRQRPLGVPPLPPPAPVSFAVDPVRNELKPYIWHEDATCALAGTRHLTLDGAHASSLMPDPFIDPIGRWVMLMTRPATPDIPERRLAVRLGNPTDSADPLTGAPITEVPLELPLPIDLDLETLVVHGNLVPATSGKTHHIRFRIGPPVDAADPNADLLQAIERVGPNSVLCYPEPDSDSDRASRVKSLMTLEGSDKVPLVWLKNQKGRMTPEIELVREGVSVGGEWTWVSALIGEDSAEPEDKVFTLEHGSYRPVVGFERMGLVKTLVDYASNDGCTIRFGTDDFGKAPPERAVFSLRYRLGNGSRMNVAPDSLTKLEQPFVALATNPLAATGGRDPESADAIRINAPQAYRAITYRAVVPADYAELAERIDAVQKAGAVSRWTGSWPTIFVTPDPRDTTVVTSGLRDEITLLLDRARQAGRETKVRDPIFADFDLVIRLCVAPDAYRGEIKELALEALFGKQGNGGFFDPDNFTFGQPLSRAELVAALQAVPGIKAVEQIRVRRPGYFDWREFLELSIPVAVNELVRVTNDRELPERGSVKLAMEGGA